MKIIKRNGVEQEFNPEKIKRVIMLANQSVSGDKRIQTEEELDKVFNYVIESLADFGTVAVETVQDKVRDAFMNYNYFEVADSFIKYRQMKATQKKFTETEEKQISICNNTSEDVKQDNANKNPVVLSTQRDYIAGTSCKAIARKILPKEIVDAHDKGLIHWHDMDYSPVQHMHNCELVNLKDMFENGFEMNGVFIDSPKSFKTACTLATQVAAQVAGQQYGGQTMSWTHIARYVDVSRQKYIKKWNDRYLEHFQKLGLSEDAINEERKTFVNNTLYDEIRDAVQTVQYQVLTILCSNGQTPFISMSMSFAECGENEQLESDAAVVFEEVLKQRIDVLDDGKGNKISAVFPKLLYVLDECNAEPGSKYYELTKLASKCAAKRMAPDFISAKIQRKIKHTNYTWPCMGCRSFLTPYTPEPLYDDDTFYFGKYYAQKVSVKDIFALQESGTNLKYKLIKKTTGEVNEIDHVEKTEDGKLKLVLRDKYFGRNNNGVVSLNLPHVALESKGAKTDFWKILDDRCELIYRALVERYKSLKGATAEAAPIQRRFGALFRLDATDTIDRFLTGPYCTYSLGYVGLWETCLYMTGKKLSDDQSFANDILNFFNTKHDEWHKRLMNENDPNSWLNTSTYGTPEEQLTTKFATANMKDFGTVEVVTDHDYVTNSYHISPAQPIDAFTKVAIESKMQDKSTGGAISYIELPNMDNNLDAVESLVQFMYNNILYCEINVRRDICYRCGFKGEIKMIKEDGKYLWECPVCKNRDTRLMDIKRRVCGYIADAKTGMSQGRMGDMYVRVYHLN